MRSIPPVLVLFCLLRIHAGQQDRPTLRGVAPYPLPSRATKSTHLPSRISLVKFLRIESERPSVHM
ncbi:hypothetical protein OF83DRAFT_845425 [Amylostereum chailletii]|nr:hypothetical protein OF83DRAFT_845425 [Amylostereum chailletii]